MLSTPIFVDIPSSRSSFLAVKFVKIASRAFEIRRPDETEKTVLTEHKRISRTLVPFVTSPSPGINYSGVFFTGDRPSWILATNKSGVKIIPSGHGVVHSFTTCSLWDSKGDFLLYSDEVRNRRSDNFRFLIRLLRDRVCSNGCLIYSSTRIYHHDQFPAPDHMHISLLSPQLV